MAINETISTGNKYRRLKDASTKLWQRLSFWTKASDVEFDNGATAETSLGNIQGITDSVNSNASNIAASAAAVNTLNSNIGNIKIYVGEDGKIHFTNKDGADSVLPFSSAPETLILKKETTTSDSSISITIMAVPGLYILVGCNGSRGGSTETFGSFSCEGATRVTYRTMNPNENKDMIQVFYIMITETRELTFTKSGSNGYSAGYMGIFQCV